MEQLSDLTGVLATLGRAVIPDFALQSVEQGMEALRKYIQAKPTLLIFDNFESVLPSSAQPGVDSWVRRHPAGTQPINPDEALAEDPLHEPEFLADLLNLAHDLAHTGDSRVIITSREAIDDPRFHNNRTTRLLPLEGLTRREAIELVGETCRLVGIKAEAAKDEDLEALVDAVSCHPRTLVLLPPLLKDRGVAGVTENLHELMAELERKHPGQREKSLYASLKLSLDRLPKDIRSKLAPLGLLRGGVSTPVLAAVLGLEEKGLTSLVETLAARALLTPEGLYLRFHPALAPFLMAELRAEQPAEVELLWHHVVEAYDELMGLLYQMWNGPQHHQATRLATRELPNLLQALAHLGRTEATTDLDRAMKFATYLEGLLQGTAYRHALAEVAVVRDGLATRGGAAGRWSEAQYLSDRAAINRLLEAGRLEEALLASEALVRNIDAAGLASWSGADHAHATAHFLRGRVLQLAGEPEAALVELMESRRSFLGLPGNKGAHMASSSLRETGDCLQALGRLDEAAESYQQAIEEHRAGGYDRDVAVAQGQLATVRLFQGSYAEALQGFRAARTIFVLLDEPVMVATAWHQEGVAQQQAGQPAAAEAAYQEALAINQTLNNLSAAAETMNQLAIVADQAGRLEEAVAWDRRALEIFCAVGHRRHEAASRTNLAERLHRLGQLVEAEAEIRQAITLQEFLGLGNQPWISWDIMHDIAHDRGDHPATIHAREKAMEWYRRYRAQGGYPKTSAAQFFAATARNLATDGEAPDALSAEFVLRLVNPRSPVWLRPLFLALIAVLKGDANTARVVLPDLNYMDAVELERLLAGTWP
jgi:tetratricopeptide (TPR) repeat protein